MRRFIVAPSMARLVRRERGSTRVIEGYFPTQASRNSHVRIEGAEGHLIITTQDENGQPVEEVTVVPRKPAEALLDVCAGRLEIERTSLAVAGRELRLERVTGAGRSLDVVTVDAGPEFLAPAWLGREIGAETGFTYRALALEGVPAIDIPITEMALNALIDTLENRFGGMFDTPRPQPEPARAQPAPQPQPQYQPQPASEAPGRRAAAPVRQEAALQAQAAPAPARDQAAREPAAARRAPEPQAEAAAQADAEPSPAKRMETIIQGLSKVLREPGLPAEGEAVVEIDRWGGRRR